MLKQTSLFVIALAALAAGSAVAKEKKPELVLYAKDSGVGLGMFGGKLLHSYGYKDKQLDNGTWEVTGQAKSANPKHSQMIAIYRSAELASAQKKPVIRVVAVNGKSLGAVFAGSNTTGNTVTTFSSTGKIDYGTRYVMEVNFVDSPDPEFHCTADVVRSECKTIDVAGAMAEIRPSLKIKGQK